MKHDKGNDIIDNVDYDDNDDEEDVDDNCRIL
jgi:hypothetical protein